MEWKECLAYATIFWVLWHTLKMISWKCYDLFDPATVIISIMIGSAISYII